MHTVNAPKFVHPVLLRITAAAMAALGGVPHEEDSADYHARGASHSASQQGRPERLRCRSGINYGQYPHVRS